MQVLPDDIEAQISGAIICSEHLLDKAMIEKLRTAQKIVEGQWLGAFPCYIIVRSGSKFETLYDDVKLIFPDDWEDTIDTADTFLMNRKMFELCKSDNEPFIGVNGTSVDLHNLFDSKMFVVACVENNVQKKSIETA